MKGKDLIELLKGHEEEEVNIHLAKQWQPQIDYQAIATGNFGDGYVLCTPHITIEHNMVFIEPGIPIGYPLEGITDDHCQIYKDHRDKLWIVEHNGDIVEFESAD